MKQYQFRNDIKQQQRYKQSKRVIIESKNKNRNGISTDSKTGSVNSNTVQGILTVGSNNKKSSKVTVAVVVFYIMMIISGKNSKSMTDNHSVYTGYNINDSGSNINSRNNAISNDHNFDHV